MKIWKANLEEAKQKAAYDLTGNIIAYEQGELNNEQIVELFQRLIDNGMAWSLQGHYGRTAMELVKAGLCSKSSK